MSHSQSYEAYEQDYGVDTFRRSVAVTSSKQQRLEHGRRRGKAPQSVNGIHRRRKRKISW